MSLSRRSFLQLIAAISTIMGCQTMSDLKHPALEWKWRTRAALPRACGGATSLTFSDSLYIFGGDAWETTTDQTNVAKVRLNNIQCFTPASNSWHPGGALPVPASNIGVGRWNEKWLIAGGHLGHGLNKNIYTSFDLKTWILSASWDQPSWGNSWSQAGACLYSFGGWEDAAGTAPMHSKLWRWDLSAPDRSPQVISNLPGTGRVLSAIAATGDDIYIFGGLGPANAATEELRDAWHYDPALDKWRPLPPMPFAMHAHRALTLHNGRILLAGGYGFHHADKAAKPDFLTQVSIFDPLSETYQQQTHLPMPVCDMAFGLVQNELIGTGGENQPKHRVAWTWSTQI